MRAFECECEFVCDGRAANECRYNISCPPRPKPNETEMKSLAHIVFWCGYRRRCRTSCMCRMRYSNALTRRKLRTHKVVKWSRAHIQTNRQAHRIAVSSSFGVYRFAINGLVYELRHGQKANSNARTRSSHTVGTSVGKSTIYNILFYKIKFSQSWSVFAVGSAFFYFWNFEQHSVCDYSYLSIHIRRFYSISFFFFLIFIRRIDTSYHKLESKQKKRIRIFEHFEYISEIILLFFFHIRNVYCPRFAWKIRRIFSTGRT